jgi:hypothetical protein
MSIEQELLAIKGKKDLLVAEEVVAWAQAHPGSALAQRFEWDDQKAGHEYRLNQARQLIISLEITIGASQRRFYSLSIDRSKSGGGYRDINDILRSKSLYDILLMDALADLERMKERYNRLVELRPLWKEVDKIKERKKKQQA